MSKNKKKSKVKSFFLFIVLVLFLVFLFIMIGAYVFNVNASAVIIKGNDVLKDEEILEISNLEKKQNFFLTSSTTIEKALRQNCFVKSVKVNKNILFQIIIEIEENRPLFIREDTNMIVLENAKEIKNNNKFQYDVPYLVNYVPDTKYKEFVKKLNMTDYSLIKKISQILYSPTKYDEDRFILYMNDSNRVYLNLPKFKNFNKYNQMVEKFEGKTGKLYLDSGNYFEIDK